MSEVGMTKADGQPTTAAWRSVESPKRGWSPGRASSLPVLDC